MAQNYVTTAQQGYQKHEGNLLDAATSAMALYNLPQSMKLAMQQKQLQNQALQLGNTGQDVTNQTGRVNLRGMRASQNAIPDAAGAIAPTTIRQPFSSSTQGIVMPGQKSAAINPVSAKVIADTEGLDNGLTAFNGLGPGSIGNGQGGNMYANTNENSSNGGISNDISPKGTSAYELGKTPGIDPYNTDSLKGAASILSQAHSKVLAGGVPNNAPAMANGASARGNSMLPDTIPGSTQGGGPASSPFNSPPFSSKGISFNSGETADNSGSMPREDSNSIPMVASNDDHAKLPVGALYKDPMGNTRRKGQAA